MLPDKTSPHLSSTTTPKSLNNFRSPLGINTAVVNKTQTSPLKTHTQKLSSRSLKYTTPLSTKSSMLPPPKHIAMTFSQPTNTPVPKSILHSNSRVSETNNTSFSNLKRRQSLIPRPSSLDQLKPKSSKMVRIQEPQIESRQREDLDNSDMINNPQEYVNILETYVKYDMMLDKQDSLNLNEQIRNLNQQIFEASADKVEAIKERTKLTQVIEEYKSKCEDLDRKLFNKETSIELELNKHREILSLRKNEIQDRYNAEIKSIEDSIKSMIDELEEESKNSVELLKTKEIMGLKKSILEINKKISQEKLLNNKKLNALKDEQDSTKEEKTGIWNNEINQLKENLSELKYIKSNLQLENQSINEKYQVKSKRFDELDEKMNLLHTYQGSLDDIMKSLKLRKLQLIEQLSDKKHETEEFRHGVLKRNREQSELSLERLKTERYKRRKVEHQIQELKKSPRIVILSTESALVSNEFEYEAHLLDDADPQAHDDFFESFQFLIEDGLRQKYDRILIKFKGELITPELITKTIKKTVEFLNEMKLNEIYAGYQYSIQNDKSTPNQVVVLGKNKVSHQEFSTVIEFVDRDDITSLDSEEKSMRIISQFIVSSNDPVFISDTIKSIKSQST